MKKIFALTKKLVSIPSDKENKEAREKALAFIEEHVKKSRPEAKTTIFKEAGVKTLYITHPEQEEEIMLCGHIDIIPAKEEQFIPREDETFIYGRGSGDMKAGVAVLIELFIKHYNKKRVSLLITTDEEIGSLHGASYAAKKTSPDAVIITEPTANNIVIDEKGGTWVEINITGLGGHASRPWKATNAIDVLLEIITELREWKQNPTREQWTDTMNIGCIKGGSLATEKNNITMTAANVIADNAAVKIDFRLTPQTKHEDVWNKIDALTKKYQTTYKDCTVIWKKHTCVAHMTTDEDNDYVRRFKEACEAMTGTATIKPEHAASDGRFFSEKGIPVIMYGPIAMNIHAENEHVEKKSIEHTYNVIDAFIQKNKS